MKPGIGDKNQMAPYAKSELPTQFGPFECLVYRSEDGSEHVALVTGQVESQEDVLCRIHSECLTGEVFGSLRCDCRAQLDLAMKTVQEAGRGIIIYLRQEGRGIGLGNKIKAYALQEKGFDTVDANRELGLPVDARDYSVAAKILRHLGARSVVLMTNNPAKVSGLEVCGVTVSDRIQHTTDVSEHAHDYLQAKINRMGHLIGGSSASAS